MSQAVLEAVIRAYDQFTREFDKLQSALKSTGQAEQQLSAATQTVNQAMTQLYATKTRAMQASERFSRALADLVRGEKQGAAATAEFEAAFTELTTAQRELEGQTESLSASLAAQGVTGERARAVTREMERAFADLGDGGDAAAVGLRGMGVSASDLIRILGQVGVLYAFKQALQDIVDVGRQYELSIRQAQSVTGDMSAALSDFAMAAIDGIQGPLQMAEAYYELGSAGLSANDVLLATPDILDFATAGLLDLDQAAYSAISTIKSFNLSWSQTREVTDAFTAAMNSTTLQAEDFQWVMSSAGAVANMAGQDFRELVAAASALKNSGIQAQDGATSIKAALLQLINPSDEARQVMEELGLELYSSSGQMKQWSEIVAEFERVLAPYNEQSRNLIMSTIAGTDGIRALAASLSTGSERLADYVAAMETADDATEAMADTMASTFDGAVRKLNGNLERTKVLIFDDWKGEAAGTLSVIDSIVVGFNSMDDSLRKLVILIVGSGGLIIALNMLKNAYTAWITQTTAATVATKALVASFNPLLLIVPVVLGAILGLVGAQQQLRLEQEANAGATQTQLGKLEQLQARYQELTDKTKRTADEEEELRRVTEQISQVIPDAVTGTDELGNVMLDSEVAAGKLKDKIDELKTSLAEYYGLLAQEAETRLPGLQSAAQSISSRIADLERQRAVAPATVTDRYTTDGTDDLAPTSLRVVLSKTEIDRELQALRAKKLEIDQSVEEANQAMQTFQKIQAGNWDFTPETISGSSGSGTKDWKGGGGAGDKARAEFEASRTWIEHQKALNKLSAEEEIAAWARVAARYQDGTTERMQADEALYSAKQRLLQEEERAWGDVYQQAQQLMKHEVTMSRMSTDEQISYLEKLRNAHGWTYQQMWEIEESLYRLRKQQLTEYLDSVEDEYRDMLDTLDSDTERSLQAIQDQLDALDREDTADSREEDLRKHNERLAELQEQRQYHALRTGSSHAKAMADLDEEVATEQREWQQTQEEWAREDKRDALRQQQSDVRDAAARERQDIEDHYKQARQIAENGVLDTVAALSATKPEWFETGKELIDQLIAGMKTGDFTSVLALVDQVRGQAAVENAATAPEPSSPTDAGTQSGPDLLATISSGQYQMVGQTAAMRSRELAGLLGKGVSWDQSQGRVIIGGQAFNPLSASNGQTMVGIRQVAESLGYGVHFDQASGSIKIYKAGEGALFDRPALSMMAEAGESEVGIPLSKFQPMMNVAMASAFQRELPGDALERAVGRIVRAIEQRFSLSFEKLVHIEHFESEDVTDAQILARELMSLVNQAQLMKE